MITHAMKQAMKHAMKSHGPRTGPRRTLAAAVATRNALPYHPHIKENA
ncbi:hypothetical protein FBY35_5186 [Streptomyces sp. SLBN-118]|nr:hypothetical protein FBY35_5186 [Streptomyces sp. SLBN-118]